LQRFLASACEHSATHEECNHVLSLLFSLHHQKSKIAFAIEMHTLDAMIEFIVNMIFLLQAIAVFTRTHDSTLRIHTLKKIFATQDKVFCCAMKRHERKVIFKMKILEKDLVLKLSHR